MRSSLKLVVAIFATAATMFGGAAWASGSHGGGTQSSQPCGTGSATVGTDAPVTLWPPNGTPHTYTFTYSGGTSGDTLTTTTTSSDGKGVVSDSAPGTADDTGTATTTDTVRAARPGTSKTGRTYTVTYTVSGSNSCTGSFTITVPHDRRKAK